MFRTKKSRIKAYLQGLPHRTAFDELLSDYLDGTLKDDLAELGITKIELHIDWQVNTKCIGIQGKYHNWFVDIQIYPHEHSFSADLDEPDDDTWQALRTVKDFYCDIEAKLSKLLH